MGAVQKILDVPLDNLLLIFKHLEGETEDQLSLAHTHPIFYKAFGLYASKRFKSVNFDEFPIAYWSAMLNLCGASVVCISTKLVANAVAMATLIDEFCPNVSELFMPIRARYWHVVKPFIKRMRKLYLLRFENNYSSISVIRTLRHLPQLRILSLHGFRVCNVMRIKELLLLEKLEVVTRVPINLNELCFAMSNLEILQAEMALINFPNYYPRWPCLRTLSIGWGRFATELPYMPNLQILSISVTHTNLRLSQIFGRSVLQYANTLQTLRLPQNQCYYPNDIQIIAQLKSLKTLQCYFIDNRSLSSIHLDELQTLFIPNSPAIRNSGVLGVLRGCKSLRRLDIFDCPLLSPDLVGPAIKVLKENGVQPDNPLVMTVSSLFGDDIIQLTRSDPTNQVLLLTTRSVCIHD
ncbi:uncharacterized protein LOC111064833 [Drosophila obscura]|uniref:uncharacterized protein LOC111064833 n=1 Tax=Drosophila obscura TaxID=7282 RepID=UPI001BB197F4|nr:uncharacterized protein LOC111064833 [Drosophila obscura]XP_022208327.2 uncharacterized protein LOC111064833 [Drosophila obscura]XP_022208328.2 uncharacterized protein LOC111064833 [Drosophila obscura]